MKKEVDQINAVPSKRLFLSIIADYDLNKSICELIDNALDIWVKDKKKRKLIVNVDLEKNQQTIKVVDNAGGVPKAELSFIVAPGQTGNVPTAELIGIFGVGTKRAVVALGQDITIATRHDNEPTYQVEFDDTWLESDSWELPLYEVPNIAEGTTVIAIKSLRALITDKSVIQLIEHLEATYGRFLGNKKIAIFINARRLKPISFESWSYPPLYPPHKYIGTLKSLDGGEVSVEVIAGLSNVSSPAGGEYGVYIYCNDRLISRGLKSYDVGFAKGLAGLPHPSISLSRIIVSLNGPAQLMPWNSSKSGINPNHQIFNALRGFLVQIVKDWSSLSRRLEGQWSEEVFKYDTGYIEEVTIEDLPSARKSYLPPLPVSRPRYGSVIIQINKIIAKDKPWATGLYEGIVIVDLISKQRMKEKNRISLILLDSILEIAFKEFLVNESGQRYSDKKLLELFSNRSEVQKEIQKYKPLDTATWQKIDYYYGLRCKLIHERASAAISDEEIANYRELVEKRLKDFFGLLL